MQKNLLVLDVGSTALKGVIFDSSGRIVAAAERPVTTRTGADGAREQSTEEWWRAACRVVTGLGGGGNVGAVALTGSMQNLIAVDASGNVTDRAILYSDGRLAAGDVEALRARLPAAYAKRSGNPLNAAATLLKLTRLERFYAPDERPAAFLFGAKDALIARMTGRLVVDPTTATTTGMMDYARRDWDEELLALAGLRRDAVPEILTAVTIAGALREEAADALGLAPGIPVHVGAGDAGAAGWGALADSDGTTYCYLGTTGWVASTMEDGAAAAGQIYRLADPVRGGRTIVISPFLSAGAAMDWLCRCLSLEIGDLVASAGELDATPPPPLFLPYLSGERGPFEDGAVRAAFLGLDAASGPAALAYGVMEGIAHAVRHNLDALGGPDGRLTLIGGAARAALQRQLIADTAGREVTFFQDGSTVTACGLCRMVAPTVGLAEPRPDSSRISPRRERREHCEKRYRAYLAAGEFARRHAEALGAAAD